MRLSLHFLSKDSRMLHEIDIQPHYHSYERKNQAVFLFAAAYFKQSVYSINGVHAVFFHLFNQVFDAAGTVEHGILRVDVQVGESCSH